MKTSAGLLMYRSPPEGLQVLLAHPGGPLWARKDLGVWSVPKGEVDAGEDPLQAARREFQEETGLLPDGEFVSLGEVRQKSGKRVLAWAFPGAFDPTALRCNLFELEWPPRSGRIQRYPEIDRVAWFRPDEARRRILPAQQPFIDRLLTLAPAAP